MRRAVFRRTHAVHLSEGLAQSIAQVTAWKSLSVLPNGIEAAPLSREVKKTSETVTKLLYLSNFIETKGVLDFVAVCEGLRARGLSFEAAIVGGSGPVIDVPVLEQRINAAGLSDCVFPLGPRYGEDKLQVLADADVFVFPSFYPQECAPLVVLEALSFCVPVVSYDIGAVSEMVEDGRSGFVVESRNIEQMTQRVAELIEQPDLLSSMSASARERFEREFTMTKFEARLRDYFAELIAKR
jgi:glycosyltransferase involved in cell wall biosynthesis